MELESGDKLVITVGEIKKVWVISAVNNRVVKYFDENNTYTQMPVTYLDELLKNNQVEVIHSADIF